MSLPERTRTCVWEGGEGAWDSQHTTSCTLNTAPTHVAPRHTSHLPPWPPGPHCPPHPPHTPPITTSLPSTHPPTHQPPTHTASPTTPNHCLAHHPQTPLTPYPPLPTQQHKCSGLECFLQTTPMVETAQWSLHQYNNMANYQHK